MVDFRTKNTLYLLGFFFVLYVIIPVLGVIYYLVIPFPILEPIVFLFFVIVIGSNVFSSNIHFDNDCLTRGKGKLIGKNTIITILYCDIDKVRVYYDFIPRIEIEYSINGKKKKLLFFIMLSQYVKLAKLYELLHRKSIDIIINYPERYLSPIVSMDWDVIVRKQKYLKFIDCISSIILLICICLCLYYCVSSEYLC